MAETNSSPVNGKHISLSTQVTGGDVAVHGTARVIEISKYLNTAQELSSAESIDPWKLYEYFASDKGEFVVDVPIGIISKTLAASVQHVRQAIQELDELERENHLAVAWSNLFGLSQYLGSWPTFDEAYALLVSAFESHRSAPYGIPELIALQKVIEILRRNPVPTDSEIGLMYEWLESTNFDLNMALGEVDLA